MDNALNYVTSVASGNSGGGVSGYAAAPLAGVSRAAGVTRLTLWGVILFLLALWGATRLAGFRFVISTGVGR